MGMFFEVLQSINDPNQQGSVNQLSTLMNTAQQLGAGQGLNATAMQTVMSSLGGLMRPALQQQMATAGPQSLITMMSQLAGGNAGGNVLSSMLPPQLQQQIIQGVAQKTGLDATMLQSMVPGLMATLMGMLSMGSSKSGMPGENPLLNAFLDGDRSGSTDLGDVFKFANRFLNAPQ